VQFHPEIFTAAGDTTMHKLFKFLVNKADTFNLAKKIHSRILSIASLQTTTAVKVRTYSHMVYAGYLNHVVQMFGSITNGCGCEFF
jgi:hypothetical protein